MNTKRLQALLRQRRIAARAAQRGMTLIEIMVVVAIIGMIVGGISVAAFGRLGAAQVDTARNQTVQIEQAIQQYMLQKKGKCPKAMEDLKAAGIINRISKDPWGEPYTFECKGTDIKVMSSGPDAKSGTDDDISNQDEADAPEES